MPFFPQSPKPVMLLGENPLMFMHMKPNPLAPVFIPYPPGYALAGFVFVSAAIELPELGAAPPRRSFTQLEFGVQVQAPAYSFVFPTPNVFHKAL